MYTYITYIYNNDFSKKSYNSYSILYTTINSITYRLDFQKSLLIHIKLYTFKM